MQLIVKFSYKMQFRQMTLKTPVKQAVTKGVTLSDTNITNALINALTAQKSKLYRFGNRFTDLQLCDSCSA